MQGRLFAWEVVSCSSFINQGIEGTLGFPIVPVESADERAGSVMILLLSIELRDDDEPHPMLQNPQTCLKHSFLKSWHVVEIMPSEYLLGVSRE